ncbi:CYFA0S11e03202g1_1 [Cyberlindnera fabianii]|uniref:CYFA0S11e03202g1_1 n=1 Tax=Cyberlindnera fabianii TaxID=36022 RepID=A0A061B8Q9_CYBFA|nr:CYFA0S11e03202g1_1 [Cyberlindnera fabianii]
MSWPQAVNLALGGLPLKDALTEDTKRDVEHIVKEVSLDVLLKCIHQRAHAAALISRMGSMQKDELNQCLSEVLQQLELPTMEWIWYPDEVTMQTPEYSKQMEFKQRAQVLLILLGELITTLGCDGTAQCLGQYSMVTPWCDSECVTISKSIIDSSSFKEEELQKVIATIQTDMKTLPKPSKVSQAGYKKIAYSNQSALRPRLGFGVEEDSRAQWKTSHIRAIPHTAFLIQQLSSKGIKDNWWIISPTILNILDDHDASIKLCGVHLLSYLLDSVSPDYLKLTGLFQIFYDAMKPLLTYLPDLTPTPLSVQIMETLYPTLLKLFKAVSTPEEYNVRIIELITDGIFFSLNAIRDHFKILEVLLQQLQVLITELKSTTIKILPRLVYNLGMVISDPFIDLHESLFYRGMEVLITTELNCWERLDGHKYDLLGFCVLSWKREQKSDRVSRKIKAATVLLDRIVGITDEDWDELIRLDGAVEDLKTLVKSSTTNSLT